VRDQIRRLNSEPKVTEMTREQALEHIRSALAETVPAQPSSIGEKTDLISEQIIDSLDTMNFLFQLEKRLGKKLPSIDEDYSDFRVGALIDVVVKDAA
jgi:acyl carrier protein